MTNPEPEESMDGPTAEATVITAVEARAADLARRDTKGFRLNAEAMQLVDELAEEFPDEWETYLSLHIMDLMTNQLRQALMRHRRAAVRGEKVGHRKSVLSQFDADTRDAMKAGQQAPDPFSACYAGLSDRWKSLGNMTRPDLMAIYRHRQGLAQASLTEMLFAKALADLLPDDETRLIEAVDPTKVLDLHADAEKTAVKIVDGNPSDDIEFDLDDLDNEEGDDSAA